MQLQRRRATLLLLLLLIMMMMMMMMVHTRERSSEESIRSTSVMTLCGSEPMGRSVISPDAQKPLHELHLSQGIQEASVQLHRVWNLSTFWAGRIDKKKVKAVYSASWETHLRATGRHLPYGITQCYLPPDTSERAPP